jgi:predicted Zn-dependent protease
MLESAPLQWEAGSVVAHWPEHQALDGADSAGVMPVVDAAPAADLPLGANAGTPDDPAAVLDLLRAQGIFEPPGATTSATPWTPPKQVERSGTRLRNTVIGVWSAALVATAGGYFGWLQWVEYRHVQAAQLLKDAKAAAFESDYKRLVDAERMLRLARDKYPRSPDIARVELFVHAQRVLENGSRDLSGLRSALSRADQLQKSGAADADASHNDAGYAAAARAVLAVYGATPVEAAQALTSAQQAAKGEAELSYVVGRLEQRVGQADATALLQAAASAAPDLLAAALALAEQQAQAGNEAEAIAGFDAILKRKPGHLRAALWRAFLLADRDDPAQGLSALDAMSKRTKDGGAPIDHILFALARARLSQRQGEHEKSASALSDALAAGASEPRLLALVASEARRVGQLGLAQQAASQAVSAAPQASAYRALLARILIERQDGEHALTLLAAGAPDDPALLVMRAQAALLSSSADAQRDGVKAIETYLAQNPNDVAASSLRIRLMAELEPSPKLLSDVKALLRRAPGDPSALRAQAEVGLALHTPDDAKSALEQLVAAAPEDPEAHQLLGRARRMAGDATGAEASFRRAVELQPGYPAALAALGSLLLDMGKYAEADRAYQAMCGQSALACRLGRAEALIALGKLDDAQAQLSGLSQAQQDSQAGRETAARLALARKKPGDAITLLRPLIDASGEKRTSTQVLYGDALYAADQVNPAAGAYDAALATDGELPEALLGRAEVHLRAERTQEALELLEKAKNALQSRLRAPEVRARMFTLYGHAYVQRNKRGDLEAARDALRKALQMNPPAEAYFWLGEAVAGKITPEAAAALKHYLEIEPNGYYAARAKRSLGPLL